MLAALERANAALVTAAAELTGSVRLASFPTATRALLPAKLAALRQKHPRLRIDLTELEPHESLPALALGRIDIAVAHDDLTARDAARDLCRADFLNEPVLLVRRACRASRLRAAGRRDRRLLGGVCPSRGGRRRGARARPRSDSPERPGAAFPTTFARAAHLRSGSSRLGRPSAHPGGRRLNHVSGGRGVAVAISAVS